MDCKTCTNHFKDSQGWIFCSLNVDNDEFEICGNHAECPYYEGEEDEK